MTPSRNLASWTLLCLALVGCGESRLTVELRDQTRDSDLAAARITAGKLYSSNDDRLLAGMEQGLLAHLQGDTAGSDQQLEAIAPLVDELRGSHVGDAVLTAVYNDTASTYVGKPFEHTQVDYYRTLNQLITAERADGRWLPASIVPMPKAAMVPAVTADPHAAAKYYEKAVIIARRMTLNQLKETADAAGGKRYDDDPFARLLTAIAVLALDPAQRTESDQQLATAMLTRAMTSYQSQHAALNAGSANFRYETAAAPAIASTLYLRHLHGYDPEFFVSEVARLGMTANDPRLVLPAGSGSVVVLNHVGLITHPQPLQIGIAAIGFSSPDSTTFNWGGITFFAKGPGSEVARTWIALPIPGDVVQKCLAPGGATIIGFEIPVHAPDSPWGIPATVTAGGISTASEVVCDLDAYARSTLKDDQPHVLLKTLIRVAAKQTLVALGASAAHQGNNESAEILSFAINLVGSAVATATESADLRAWLTLPDHVEASLIDLPAGTHSVSIATANGPRDLGTVQVTPGRLTVVTIRSFPAH